MLSMRFHHFRYVAGSVLVIVSLVFGHWQGSVTYGDAPKVPPAEVPEPETRTLNGSEAKAALERDWLFQAEGEPLLARALAEVAWAREMAARLANGQDASELSNELAELDELQARIEDLSPESDASAQEKLYIMVRQAKRQIMFKHPEVDFSRVLFVDSPFTHGLEWHHESRYRSGSMCATEGGRLLVLDGLHPGGALRKLAPIDGKGAFLRPDLSFDAKRSVFCMKPESDKAYHLYEVNLDGLGYRQLTFGDYDDIDPIYVPGGNVIFVSSRSNCYAGCGPWAPAHVLTRCDGNGENIYILSPGSEPEYSPALLEDGRVLYTRWEYNDKWVQRIQGLWAMNPDGTRQSAYWGNQSEWPDHIGEAQPVPGSPLVMFTGMGHHDVYKGSIGLIDPRMGLNYPTGLIKVTAELPWAEVGDGPIKPPSFASYHTSGRFGAYKAPFPLSPRLFLVSARKGLKEASTPSDTQRGYFTLYLMDIHGNRELIYEGAFNILYAQPVRPRRRPPVVPDTVAWPGREKEGSKVEPGAFLSGNVYEGMPPQVRGKAKYLRVIENIHRTWSVGVVSAGGSPFGSTCNLALDLPKFKDEKPDAAQRGLWGDGTMLAGPATSLTCNTRLKRVIGTVPVEEDGSFRFEAPPAVSLYFQLLDEDYRSLQTMRSWTSVMPGEVRSCVGCHEMHTRAPSVASAGRYLGQPAAIVPPPWGVKTLSYVRNIQPLLDKHCGSCHQGNGQATQGLDLTLRPHHDLTKWGGIFPEPYVTLVLGERQIAGIFMAEQSTYQTIAPMTVLSFKSRLVDIARGGEPCKVKMGAKDLRMLIAWVDTMGHYRDEQDVRSIPDPNPAWFTDWPYPPRMRTAPIVKREFCQDEYLTQEDRLLRDSHGNILPPVDFQAAGEARSQASFAQ